MSIRFRRNTKYPSTQKPGVFPLSSSLDEVGNDLNTDLWDKLTGVSEDQQNQFAFSLGSWIEFSRANRRIKVADPNEANFLNPRIDGDPVEPQPITEPEGFVRNTLENAAIQEPSFNYNSHNNEIERILYTTRGEARAAKSPEKAFRAGRVKKYSQDDYVGAAGDATYGVESVVGNLHTPRWVHLNKKGTRSPDGEWVWYPTQLLQPIDSNYPNEIQGRWYPADASIVTVTTPSSADIISGLATKNPIRFINNIGESL